jgi:CRISPR-associated protein Cmr3
MTFTPAEVQEVLSWTVQGPLLFRQSGEGRPELLLPAPADALLFEGGCSPRRLEPIALPAGAGCSLPFGLLPVGCNPPDPRKPASSAPAFWTWAEMKAWLCSAHVEKLVGQALPQAERRIHVSLDPATGTARDGMLFGVEGRNFSLRKEGPPGGLGDLGRLGLLLRTDAPLQGGARSLGGERRLAAWSRVDMALPELPSEVLQSARLGALRLITLTPAWFRAGARPTDLLSGTSPSVRLSGMVNGRPEVVSGWDHARREAKPTRRLLPAGSVLFLRLEGSPEDCERWARQTWLSCISDLSDPSVPDWRPRQDGLGLCLLGAWSGQASPLQLS